MLRPLGRAMNRVYASLFGQKGGYYRRSFIWILVISAIPGVLTGACMYGLTDGRIGTELQRLHQSQIQARASSLDDQLSYLELALSHWAFDPKFSADLSHKSFVNDYQDALDISKTLSVMQGAHPLAKRVELYLQSSPPIIFNPEYSVLYDAQQAGQYRMLAEQPRTFFWMNWQPDPKHPEQTELVLAHKIPALGAQPDGLLIVYINQDKLVQNLKTLTPYDDGVSFMLKDDGSFLVTASKDGSPSPFEEALRAKVTGNEAGTGSFMMNWNHEAYSVSYGRLEQPGSNRYYVSAAPVQAVTTPVVLLSKLVLAVSLAALAVAAILALIASRRIYSPVERLVHVFAGGGQVDAEAGEDEFQLLERKWKQLDKESRTLKGRLDDQLTHVRTSFLLQLFQGYLYAYSERDLLERMRQYGWNAEGRRFIVLCVQLGGMTRLRGRFRQGDEGLLTFAAANIIEELAASGRPPGELSVVNFHDLSVGVLLFIPEAGDCRQELHCFCESVVQTVNRILSMQVTITISRASCSITDIPDLFEDASGAVAYCSVGRQNQIVELDGLDKKGEAQEARYPFGLEREIIQRLRAGQEEETGGLIEDFMREMLAGGAKEIDLQQGMLQLLGSILHAVIHAGMNPKYLYHGANMFEQLSQIREPEQMADWFRSQVIAPYMEEMERRSVSEAHKTVENVICFINGNYMKDISLEQCADLNGTTAYYLSKAFKQVTGENFIDYLTGLRMEKAKELLRDTELKINDVSERVGYQHTYFNRIFKKQEGVTPSRYREMSRVVTLQQQAGQG